MGYVITMYDTHLLYALLEATCNNGRAILIEMLLCDYTQTDSTVLHSHLKALRSF